MSYEPTQWKAGDTVTSAKLNKLEQGVANSGGSSMVGMTMTQDNSTITYTVDKTWQEIWDNNYTMIYVEDGPYGKMFFQIDGIDPTYYSIHIINSILGFDSWLSADNANDYPTLTSETGGEK